MILGGTDAIITHSSLFFSFQIKRIAPSNLQTTAANVQVTENSAKLACEPGMVFEVVNGSGSETDRSKCCMYFIVFLTV